MQPDSDAIPACTQVYIAGTMLLTAAQVAVLADALQPLLPEHSTETRRTAARAWLAGLLDQVRAAPLALATGTQQLVPSALLRARVEQEARDWRCALLGGH
ncbi:MAG TPA: hypothetical protein VFS21_19910 [Roseiflexaceae bacterium]|nr:hypothetical protein [Roseiflexaceae bacterium]